MRGGGDRLFLFIYNPEQSPREREMSGKRLAKTDLCDQPPLKRREVDTTAREFADSARHFNSVDHALELKHEDISPYSGTISVPKELYTDEDCARAFLEIFLAELIAYCNVLDPQDIAKFIQIAVPRSVDRLSWLEDVSAAVDHEIHHPGILGSMRIAFSGDAARIIARDTLEDIVAHHIHTIACAQRDGRSSVLVESCPALRPGSRLLRAVRGAAFTAFDESEHEDFFGGIRDCWIHMDLGWDLCSDEEYKNIRETFLEHAFRAMCGLPEMDTEAKPLTVLFDE